MQTKRDLVMIQSPRGQINVTAPIGFPIESAENHMNQKPSIISTQRSEIDDTGLVKSSTEHITSTNPLTNRILKQSASHCEVSENSTRCQCILGTRRNTPDRVETMVLHIENGDIGTRQHRNR